MKDLLVNAFGVHLYPLQSKRTGYKYFRLHSPDYLKKKKNLANIYF